MLKSAHPVLALLLLAFLSTPVMAQICETGEDSSYCKPSLPGMPRPKALELNRETVFSYGLESRSENPSIGSSDNRVSFVERYSVKLKMPLYLSDGFNAALGFDYKNEDYIFYEVQNPDYALQQGLSDQNLKSLGTALYLSKSWKGKRYFGMKVGAELSGDYHKGTLPLSDYLKLSAAPMLGYKLNELTFLGGGLYFSQKLGRSSLYPFMVFNKTFNEKWGLETILPAKARLRFNLGEQSVLYTGVSYNSSSYVISMENEELQTYGPLQLRASEIRLGFEFEREIHDFLWFRVDGGMRKDTRFELLELSGRGANVISSDRGAAPYVNVGLFLVPPEKWMKN